MSIAHVRQGTFNGHFSEHTLMRTRPLMADEGNNAERGFSAYDFALDKLEQVKRALATESSAETRRPKAKITIAKAPWE